MMIQHPSFKTTTSPTWLSPGLVSTISEELFVCNMVLLHHIVLRILLKSAISLSSTTLIRNDDSHTNKLHFKSALTDGGAPFHLNISRKHFL